MTSEHTAESVQQALQIAIPNADIASSAPYDNSTAYEIHIPAGSSMPEDLRKAIDALTAAGNISMHREIERDGIDTGVHSRRVASHAEDIYITITNSKLGLLAEAIEQAGKTRSITRGFELKGHQGHASRRGVQPNF